MNLIEDYLRAVGLLLPKSQRDDITTELRDIILTRIEARETEKGRKLTDDEIETELHEIGHPLVVAAQYRQAPKSLVGAEIYPYWAFAVKVGIVVSLAAAFIVLVVQLTAGDTDSAITHALGSAISMIISVVGVATIIAWAFGQFGWQARFTERWRVRDLRYLALEVWDLDTWLERLRLKPQN